MTSSTHSLRSYFQERHSLLGVLFMFITTMGLLTSPVLAGGGKGHHRHTPAEKLEKLTKKLSLTDAQRTAILPILKAKHQKMEALHSQMKEVRQNAMAQVKAQLTPEQQEKFQKAQEKRQRKMEKYRDGHRKKGGKGKHGKSHKKHKQSHGDDHDEEYTDEDDDDHDDDEDEYDDSEDERKGKKGKRGKGRR